MPHPSYPLAASSARPGWRAWPDAPGRPAVPLGGPVPVPAQRPQPASPVHPAPFWADWVDGSDRHVPARISPAWLGSHGRLVVVAPHPDDEVLMCAGLMQSQLERGGAVEVVVVSGGEACFGPHGALEAVALQRRAERSASARVLGAEHAPVHWLGIADGQVRAHRRMLARRLEALLRRGDLVVGPWRLDGEPDHDAVGHACAAACAARGATLLEAPVWMWQWARPDHPAMGWKRLARLALSPHQVLRKWHALGCHTSQLLPRGDAPPVLGAALQQRLRWSFEGFFF